MPAESFGVVASARSKTARGNCHVRNCRAGRGAIAGLTKARITTDRAVRGPGIFVPDRCNAADSRPARGVLPAVFARDRGFVPEDGWTFSRRLVQRGRRVEFGIGFRPLLAVRFPTDRAFPGFDGEYRRKR